MIFSVERSTARLSCGTAHTSLASDRDDDYHPTSHFLPRILGLIESGQLDVAERDARWIQQRGAEERRPIAETGGCLFAAMVLLRRGQTNACVKAAEEALTTSPGDNQPYMRRLAWALLARAQVLRGDVGSAIASLREFDQAPHVVDGFGEVEYVRARSQVRGAGFDRDGARICLAGRSGRCRHTRQLESHHERARRTHA